MSRGERRSRGQSLGRDGKGRCAKYSRRRCAEARRVVVREGRAGVAGVGQVARNGLTGRGAPKSELACRRVGEGRACRGWSRGKTSPGLTGIDKSQGEERAGRCGGGGRSRGDASGRARVSWEVTRASLGPEGLPARCPEYEGNGLRRSTTPSGCGSALASASPAREARTPPA